MKRSEKSKPAFLNNPPAGHAVLQESRLTNKQYFVRNMGNKFHVITLSIIPALILSFGFQVPQSTTKSTATNPEVTAEEIFSHIKYLASDELEGRYPGTPGSREAMDYIINQFRHDGILPAGDNGDYRQHFDFVSGIMLGDNNSLQVNGTDYQVGKDFIPLGFSSNGSLEAEVVFVGYGFFISDSLQWDSYSDVDVEGKWVMIIRGGPEGDSPHSPYEPHLPLRKKVLVAKDKGAGGVLFVSRVSDEPDELIKLRYDHDFVGAGIPVLHISQTVAETILSKGSLKQSLGKRLSELQDLLEENNAPHSTPVSGVKLRASVTLEKVTVKIANILGIIPGNDLDYRDEYVIIGAHFDHLGYGGEGSRSTVPDTVAIHNGADDNASGVAGVLELGQRLMAHREDLKRSVLLMCYDAEEQGTLGSKYFVDNPTIGLDKITVMLNMDMVGRMGENKLTIGGTGTSPDFEVLLDEINRKHDLVLKMSEEGYGPSDHAPFYINDIPVLFFFTGTHGDYHKPSDDWDKINSKGEKRVLDFVYDVVVYFSQKEDKPLFTEAGPKEPTQTRRSFKVTFGVIPSYGSQEEGMEIDGTRPNGPADKAGMQKGDIIIVIDGKEVKNIYDYMYRLGELKPGQSVDVKVKRGEKILTMTLQL